jgi:hypothetical protein
MGSTGGLTASAKELVIYPLDYPQTSACLTHFLGGTGFNATTGALIETVSDPSGAALRIPALNGIAFGNLYANQPDVSLFFTAGPSNGTAGGYGGLAL